MPGISSFASFGARCCPREVTAPRSRWGPTIPGSVAERRAAGRGGEECLELVRLGGAGSDRRRLVRAVIVAGSGAEQPELAGQPPHVRALLRRVVGMVHLEPEQS